MRSSGRSHSEVETPSRSSVRTTSEAALLHFGNHHAGVIQQDLNPLNHLQVAGQIAMTALASEGIKHWQRPKARYKGLCHRESVLIIGQGPAGC